MLKRSNKLVIFMLLLVVVSVVFGCKTNSEALDEYGYVKKSIKK